MNTCNDKKQVSQTRNGMYLCVILRTLQGKIMKPETTERDIYIIPFQARKQQRHQLKCISECNMEDQECFTLIAA